MDSIFHLLALMGVIGPFTFNEFSKPIARVKSFGNG